MELPFLSKVEFRQTNERKLMHSSASEYFNDIDTKMADLQSTPITQLCEGSANKSPIIFLSGLLETPSIWEGAAIFCASQNVTAYGISLPGHFPWTDQSHDRLFEDQNLVHVYANFLKKISPQNTKCRLVGHSSGGMIAL
ncbi:alpha/beta fold hydrolase [Parasulfitobacter algicola]|uniref:Alpha/beta hydrolase n=1 Tax=Parasulfitobacter algicola TaxID=2614809 RepID=A0ABX2ITD5_9RHOB|nr:alpha/beta hydrolase [Sulfitobacter algicola]NSX54340.1 alpha/beta hydrolase [Sulfitobacter algicola]